MIGSSARVNARCLWGGVVWSFKWGWGTQFCLCTWYQSQSSPIISGLALWATFSNSSMVFPLIIESGNPITIVAFWIMHIIDSPTDVNIFLRPSLFATSPAAISKSQTHLHTMNNIVETWCTRNVAQGSLEIDCLLPGTRLPLNWWIGPAFSIPTTLFRPLCST